MFDPSSSEEEFVDDETGPIAGAAAVAPELMPSEPVQQATSVVAVPEIPGAPPVLPGPQDGAAPVVVEAPPLAIAVAPSTAPAIKRPTTGPASRFEWRTPPLWGFRDSGPYLHDGRADTLDQAVALHGGEAARIAQKFFSLRARERRQLEAFLKSLTAPPPEAPERVASTK